MATAALVNIDVPDLAAGRRFYEDGLGLVFRRLLFDGGVAEMAFGAVSVFLIEQPAGSSAWRGAAAKRD